MQGWGFHGPMSLSLPDPPVTLEIAQMSAQNGPFALEPEAEMIFRTWLSRNWKESGVPRGGTAKQPETRARWSTTQQETG